MLENPTDTKQQSLVRARGIDRLITILNFIYDADKPLKPAEIAKGLSAPRSTTYDIVNSMLEAGFLVEVSSDGMVFLGRTLMFFGESHRRHNDILNVGKKTLKELSQKTGETTQLCQRDKNEYVIMMMETGTRHFHISCNIGEKLPLPWTASGRLLLMHMSENSISELLNVSDFSYPVGQNISMQDFVQEIRTARTRGYWCMDSALDSFTRCFAAPVVNIHKECVATICITAPKEETSVCETDLITAVTVAAKSLSWAIGGYKHP